MGITGLLRDPHARLYGQRLVTDPSANFSWRPAVDVSGTFHRFCWVLSRIQRWIARSCRASSGNLANVTVVGYRLNMVDDSGNIYARRARLSTKAIGAALTLTAAAGLAVILADHRRSPQLAEGFASDNGKILMSGPQMDPAGSHGLLRQ